METIVKYTTLVVGVGLIGLYVYLKAKSDKPESVVADKPVSTNNPPVAQYTNQKTDPAAPPVGAVLWNQSDLDPIVAQPLDEVLPNETEVIHQTQVGTVVIDIRKDFQPNLYDDVPARFLDDPNPVVMADTHLPIIPGKNILIYGVATAKSSDLLVYTNGVRQVVTDNTPTADIFMITRVQNGIWRRISAINKVGRSKGCVTLKNQVGRLELRISVPHVVPPEEVGYVLIRISSEQSGVFVGMKSVYMLIERDGFVTSVPECEVGSLTWALTVDAICKHFLYVVHGKNTMTKDEEVGLRKMLNLQTIDISNKLKSMG